MLDIFPAVADTLSHLSSLRLLHVRTLGITFAQLPQARAWLTTASAEAPLHPLPETTKVLQIVFLTTTPDVVAETNV